MATKKPSKAQTGWAIAAAAGIAGASTIYATYDGLILLLARDKITTAILTERERVQDVEAEMRKDLWKRMNARGRAVEVCRIMRECSQFFTESDWKAME